MKTLLTAIAVLLVFSTAHANYTFDGVIDPAEFSLWKKKFLQKTDVGTDTERAHFIVEHNGMSAFVSIAELSNGELIIMEYAYVINNILHVFAYDAEKQHYTQVHPKEVTYGKEKGKRI